MSRLEEPLNLQTSEGAESPQNIEVQRDAAGQAVPLDDFEDHEGHISALEAAAAHFRAAQREFKALKQQSRVWRDEKKASEQQLEQLAEELSCTQKALREKDEVLQRQACEMESLCREKGFLEKEVKNLTRKLSQAWKDLEEVKKTFRRPSRSIECLEEQVDELEHNIKHLTCLLFQGQEALRERDQRLQEQTSRLESLTQENEALHRKLEETLAEKDAAAVSSKCDGLLSRGTNEDAQAREDRCRKVASALRDTAHTLMVDKVASLFKDAASHTKGLIKIRGDKCWRDLTCMDYHYETQPVPNPMSYYLHRSPWWFHRFETLSNHFIELIAPFFTFMGRRMCAVNGAIQILFQVVLISSGNLSFLNWLTIVPSLACFDDASLAFLFGSRAKRAVLEIQKEGKTGGSAAPTKGMLIRRVVNISLGVLIGCLSVPVVMNLLSSRQVMNTSFDPLRIVNTYGAFGSITKERTEVIFQGTLSPDPKDPGAVWEEYQFLCKPGDVHRRPCLISPYHYRLDWLMWFAAFQTYEQSEWVIHIAGRLLSNDSSVLSLMDHNPFQGRDPPRWVRGEHFIYKFSKPGSSSAAEGKWWLRKRIGAYFPPVDLQGLRGYFQSRNWPHPHIPAGTH